MQTVACGIPSRAQSVSSRGLVPWWLTRQERRELLSQAGEKHRVHAGDWGALARGVVRGRPPWPLWNVGP